MLETVSILLIPITTRKNFHVSAWCRLREPPSSFEIWVTQKANQNHTYSAYCSWCRTRNSLSFLCLILMHDWAQWDTQKSGYNYVLAQVYTDSRVQCAGFISSSCSRSAYQPRSPLMGMHELVFHVVCMNRELISSIAKMKYISR